MNKELETEALSEEENDETDLVEKDEQKSLERKPVFTRVRETKENVHDVLFRSEANLIDGKSIKEWNEYFHIDISEASDIKQILFLLSRINSLLSFVHSKIQISSLAKKLIDREILEERSRLFTRFKNAKGKAPSNDLVESRIETEIADKLLDQVYSDFIYDFWTNNSKHLSAVRKILENILIGLSVDIKAGARTSIISPKETDDDWD